MLKRFIFTSGLSRKLQPLFQGPYQIIRRVEELHVKVKNCNPSKSNKKRKYETVHLDRIKSIGEVVDDIRLASKVKPQTTLSNYPQAISSRADGPAQSINPGTTFITKKDVRPSGQLVIGSNYKRPN